MRWPLVLALAACSGSSTSTSRTHSSAGPTSTPAAGLAAELLGMPVWDGPLTDPMARRMLDRVRGALDIPPPKLAGKDPRSWLGPLQGWVDRRVEIGREIRADADAIREDSDPRMQLLAAVALGVAVDDLVGDLTSIEMPAEAASGEFAEETRRVFRETLEEQSATIAAFARVAFRRCLDVAPRAPAAVRVWEAYCRERDGKLAELEARVEARGKRAVTKAPPGPPAMFKDCESKEVRRVPPEAPPPDRKAKPVIAFIYDGTQLTGDDAVRLERAVAAKLGKDVNMPVVSAKELAAARKLVVQRKLHARAPVCGQAPPLPAVIAHRRKHLVIGEITTTCIYEMAPKAERCGLLVQFSRAGGGDHDGLPQPVFAKVRNLDVPVADWIAAADALVADEGAGGLLGSLSQGGDRMFFDVSNFADDDPWLRVPSTLEDITVKEMHACVDGPASFDATFTVSKAGKTSAVMLAPVTQPAAGSKVAACVKQALEATPWPCPQTGKAAKVTVRMCVAPRP